jgi:hypothetical protein
MKRSIVAMALFCVLASTWVWSASYDWSETKPAYSLHLRIPEAVTTIAPLKADILQRFQVAAKAIKEDAESEKEASPSTFHPYQLDTQWRVTFESPRVLSLSGFSFVDENGAHPNNDFDTIVWDKTAGRSVSLTELFEPGRAPDALQAISHYAKGAFVKWLEKQDYDAAHNPDNPDPTEGHLDADPAKLDHYALTYASGESKANGIVLLYGAGAAWPHVIGDVKLSIPVLVFRQYLTPQWASQFK